MKCVILQIAGAERVLLPALIGFTIFALCFQGVFYFFEYRNGDSIAPTYVKLQKDLIWTIVLSFVFYVGAIQARKIDHLMQPYNMILLTFCFWVIAVKVVELLAYETYSVLLLAAKNLVLCAAMVPLLGMLGEETKRSLVKQALVAFVAVALIQTAFSAALFILFPEHAFWKDDPYHGFNPFVGLFSNPNRFALFLNLGAAVLCTVLVSADARRAHFAAVGLLVLALSIFYTAALSQLIVYFGILSYATAIAALKMPWRCVRLPAVTIAAILAIGFVGLNFKSPLPDETHSEAELAWDLRNMASLAIHGKTLDGEAFRFTPDSFVNRGGEIIDLLESFGFQTNALQSLGFKKGARIAKAETAKSTWQQRLFGRTEQMAPASQSQFAYIYFRYGLVGLLLFAGVLAIPAVRSLLAVMRGRPESDIGQVRLSYHLCLAAFVATFLADNGLLDFPTNFLLFFVLFANQSLAGLGASPAVEFGCALACRPPASF